MEKAPKTDEEWTAILNSAYVMTEAGNLMMMGSRAKDSGEWMKQSQALVDIGVRTVQIVRARDKGALFTVGGDIYEVCSSCHRTYLVTAEGIPK